MNGASHKSFGVIIAFVLPGFICTWGVSLHSELVAKWINGSEFSQASIGEMLFSTVLALGCGFWIQCITRPAFANSNGIIDSCKPILLPISYWRKTTIDFTISMATLCAPWSLPTSAGDSPNLDGLDGQISQRLFCRSSCFWARGIPSGNTISVSTTCWFRLPSSLPAFNFFPDFA